LVSPLLLLPPACSCPPASCLLLPPASCLFSFSLSSLFPSLEVCSNSSESAVAITSLVYTTDYSQVNLTAASVCITACKEDGYSYAGILGASACYCGNSYGAVNTSSACSTPCPADGSQCGGPDAISVYFSGSEKIRPLRFSLLCRPPRLSPFFFFLSFFFFRCLLDWLQRHQLLLPGLCLQHAWNLF